MNHLYLGTVILQLVGYKSKVLLLKSGLLGALNRNLNIRIKRSEAFTHLKFEKRFYMILYREVKYILYN